MYHNWGTQSKQFWWRWFNIHKISGHPSVQAKGVGKWYMWHFHIVSRSDYAAHTHWPFWCWSCGTPKKMIQNHGCWCPGSLHSEITIRLGINFTCLHSCTPHSSVGENRKWIYFCFFKTIEHLSAKISGRMIGNFIGSRKSPDRRLYWCLYYLCKYDKEYAKPCRHNMETHTT